MVYYHGTEKENDRIDEWYGSKIKDTIAAIIELLYPKHMQAELGLES